MPHYLVVFVQIHPNFRLPELLSLAQLAGVKLDIPQEHHDTESPFMTIELPNDEVAKSIISRAILIKGIFELWGSAANDTELVSYVQQNQPKHLIELSQRGTPFVFRFVISAFGKKLGLSYSQELIKKFSFLPLENGIVNLKGENLDLEIHIIEDYGGNWKSSSLRRIFLLRFVGEGSRDAVFKFNLKGRSYLGTTSMDAELALIMGNQALAKKGDIILDPFAGTGSVMLPCAHYGAYTLGSDIDSRTIKGTGKRVCDNIEGSNLHTNFVQYNMKHKVDVVIADNARTPWTGSGKPFLNAIVTDPPYGIRESARQLANGTPWKNEVDSENSPTSSQSVTYVPRKVSYSMDDILKDMVQHAAQYLILGGRLVYWLATSKKFTLDDIPVHPCLKLVSYSEQPFGKWSRWLITMEKCKEYDVNDMAIVPTVEKGGIPSYRNFRDHYFGITDPTTHPNPKKLRARKNIKPLQS